METQQETISKWNLLTDQQKAAFGDRMISGPDSNLRAWCKTFENLSEWKKKSVLKNLPNTEAKYLNNIIGFGVGSS
jgi:hypothetical protein